MQTRKANTAVALIEHQMNQTTETVAALFPATLTLRLLGSHGREQSFEFADSCVLQTDVAGFTKYASSAPPREVISVVSRMFATMDAAALHFGVDKVHTVGDSFVGVISVLSQRHPNIAT